MDEVRIVLADDHPIAREGIKRILSQEDGIRVIGEAGDGEEALRLAQQLEPDVLVLDMEMPGMKGPEVAKKLKDSHSAVRTLALSTYNSKQFIFSMLEQGAFGYLTKEEVPEKLVDAVRGVACGEQGWVSRGVAATMATWNCDGKDGNNPLNQRELDILRWVTQGKTNQEISYVLGISQKTVERHLESIYSKLAVSSRVEAAVLAMREELV